MKPLITLRRPLAGLFSLLKMGLLLGLGTVPLAAQAQDKGPPRLSLKVGGIYANLTGDDFKQLAGPDYTTRLGNRHLGYQAGAALRIPVSQHGALAIQPELLLSMRGYRIEGDRTSGLATGEASSSFTQKRALTYLDLPLLANVNLQGWFLEFGPQFGYLVHTKAETTTTTRFADGSPEKSTSTSSTGKSDLTRFDIGVIGGVGYQTTGGLSLGLRLNRGLTAVLDPAGATSKPKAYNDALMLQAAYLLPAGR
ncbi:porin family protein [Hymenobacter segetis]|uniref:Porin family protein n=1 Tax=Hymenobacter segetis TaxID=2025509 RepID=A0ABU9M0H1_9BACT